MQNPTEFVLRQCHPEHLADICRIQEEAFAVLENPELLRRNSREMLAACLQEPHYTVGAFCGDVLAGFAVLYDGGETEENLGRDIGLSAAELDSVINLKLVIVSPAYRGNGLQRKMTAVLEAVAAERSKQYICATVSPHNAFSRSNIEGMGYRLHSCKKKYNGVLRNLYYKRLE